jgi:hypothetical protein
MMVTLVFVLLGAGGGAWWMMLAMAVCEDDEGRFDLVSGMKEFMPWCSPAVEITEAHDDSTVPDWCSRLVVPEWLLVSATTGWDSWNGECKRVPD